MGNMLLTKGIILQSGEVNKDKVNLVAGAITQPFAEMVWLATGGDMETVNRFCGRGFEWVSATKQTAAFVGRRWKGILIAIAALLLLIMVLVGVSAIGTMLSGGLNSVLGTSYTSEDSDLVGTEQDYTGLENALQSEIDNIERDHPDGRGVAFSEKGRRSHIKVC